MSLLCFEVQELDSPYLFVLMLLFGASPVLLLSPQLWPILLAGDALVHIHQKDDSDLQTAFNTECLVAV